MKTLNIAGKNVTLDTGKLSKGLCELHNSNDEMKAALAFGMLDNGLCEMMRKNIIAAVKSQFSLLNCELFEDRINDFCKECSNEIEKGVYKHAKMIV